VGDGIWVKPPKLAQSGSFVHAGEILAPYIALDRELTQRWREAAGGSAELGGNGADLGIVVMRERGRGVDDQRDRLRSAA
jgi:hypothetical protein